jgi:hypothetical protein
LPGAQGASGVAMVGRPAEGVEGGGHLQRFAFQVGQGEIHRRPPVVVRAEARVGHVAGLGQDLPHLPLERTFALDVLKCDCGGARQVLAFLPEPRVAQEALRRLGLPSTSPPISPPRHAVRQDELDLLATMAAPTPRSLSSRRPAVPPLTSLPAGYHLPSRTPWVRPYLPQRRRSRPVAHVRSPSSPSVWCLDARRHR